MLSDLNMNADQDARIDLTLDFGWQPEKERVILTSLTFEAPTDADFPRTIFRAELRKQNEWQFHSDFFSAEDQPRFWPYAEICLQSGFLPLLILAKDTPQDRQSKHVGFTKALLRHFRSEIESFLRNIEYMQPVRPNPRRLYVLNDDEQRRWEQQGLGGFLKLIRMRLSEEESAQVNDWLKKLNFAKSIEPKSFSKSPELAPVTELLLDEGEGGHDKINLADVGFGNSQALPVIIQSVLAEPDSLLIVEQPELHLHPRAQAELGDMFVEMVRQGAHLLLETHSEHLLLRLRRWTTEQTTGKSVLSNDKKFLKWGELVTYFIHRKDRVSSITRIGIDANGDLENIPEGFEDFFSDDLLESIKLTELQLTSENEWDSDDESDN